MPELTDQEIMAGAKAYRPAAAAMVGDAHADDVVATAAAAAWGRRCDFDPSRGPALNWIGGFVRRSALDLRRKLATQNRYLNEVAEESRTDSLPRISADPLDMLIERMDATTTVSRVGELVESDDWQLLLEVALNNKSVAEAAEIHGISERQARQRLTWIRQVASTVRDAQKLASTTDNITIDDIVACVPVSSEARRQLLVGLLETPQPSGDVLAARTGLTKKTIANEKTRLLQLARIALEVARE